VSRKKAHHPQALRDRLFAESQRPNPWQPALSYRIVLVYRDRTTSYRHAEDSLEKARAEVQRAFDFDLDDELHGAWIREEVRC
jgi:hypothetical protein